MKRMIGLIVIGLIFFGVLIFVINMFLNLNDYFFDKNNKRAMTHLRNAFILSQNYFGSDYNGIFTIDLLEKNGFKTPSNVSFEIHGSKVTDLILTSTHKKGNEIYMVDRDGNYRTISGVNEVIDLKKKYSLENRKERSVEQWQEGQDSKTEIKKLVEKWFEYRSEIIGAAKSEDKGKMRDYQELFQQVNRELQKYSSKEVDREFARHEK